MRAKANRVRQASGQDAVAFARWPASANSRGSATFPFAAATICSRWLDTAPPWAEDLFGGQPNNGRGRIAVRVIPKAIGPAPKGNRRGASRCQGVQPLVVRCGALRIGSVAEE